MHIDLNIHYKKNKYKWCTFKKFKEEFFKYDNWKIDPKNHYFLNNDDAHCLDYHIIESIIVINGENIVLYPIDYILFKSFCNKTWNKMKNADNKVFKNRDDLIKKQSISIAKKNDDPLYSQLIEINNKKKKFENIDNQDNRIGFNFISNIKEK
jgi:hypothetical protein